MRLVKRITIKNKAGTIEIAISKEGDSRFDSDKFKKDFNTLVDNIMITLIDKECHYSDIQNEKN